MQHAPVATARMLSLSAEMESPAHILPRAAARYGAKPALIVGGRTFTYAELDDLAGRAAAGLRNLGIQPGERVSLYAPNRWEWIAAYHGLARIGAVVNPINALLTPEEVAYIAGDCGATAILVSPEKAPTALELAASLPALRHVVVFGDEVDSRAVAFSSLLQSPPPSIPMAPPDPASVWTIGYTSGTTGHPKGAMQSHRAVFLNCALAATVHGRNAGDILVTGLPLPHVYGNIITNSLFLAGGTVVLMERFDPAAALALIEEHGATLFEGVPTMYATMLAHPDVARRDLSSLTRCTVGGQTISVATVEEWERRSGAPLIELWGMTEIAGGGTTHPLHSANVHWSIGVSLPGVEVRVVAFDDPGRELPRGEAGELMVRGPIVMEGYWNNPAATRETIEPDGWLHTGDVATMDAEGRCFIVDRRKDMILTGGYNVYPAEIERVVAAHPAVAMVAVGSVPDAMKGELARAYVVLRPGATASEEEIVEWCRPHLAAYKLPRSVHFVADLPKTSTGKILRRQLRTLD